MSAHLHWPRVARWSRVLRLFALGWGTISAQTATPLPGEWSQVDSFPAERLHAWADTVVAWTARETTISHDGGRSWRPALGPGRDVGVVRAAAWREGVVVLNTDGLLWPGGGRASHLAVDGEGSLYLGSEDGRTVTMVGRDGPGATFAGALLAPLGRGVLVRNPQGALVVLRPEGPAELAAQPMEALPQFFRLAPCTGPAADLLPESTGRLFVLSRQRLHLRSESAGTVLAWWQQNGVRYELVQHGEAAGILEHRRQQRTHPATRGLPPGVRSLAGTQEGLVAATPKGLWLRRR
jgi:hypothetical protein